MEVGNFHLLPFQLCLFLFRLVGRTSTDPKPARPVFTVTRGKSYRFRIINASAISQFNFQIQGHAMTVIEVDGVNHVPLLVPAGGLLIHPGQRYSVVVRNPSCLEYYEIYIAFKGGSQSNPW